MDSVKLVEACKFIAQDLTRKLEMMTFYWKRNSFHKQNFNKHTKNYLQFPIIQVSLLMEKFFERFRGKETSFQEFVRKYMVAFIGTESTQECTEKVMK